MSTSIVDTDFPVWALLPKRETGVTSFLSKYPEYDGRGIIIAIFDSGVDPGAPGLQETSDGKPKIIGRFDCTGSGDVDTSTVVQAINGAITGKTGRSLKIPKDWNNPSGNFHIGLRNAYQLYPKALRDRIEKERKLKVWDPGFKEALATSTGELSEFTKVISEIKNLSREDKLKKDDLEAQVEMLHHFEKKYEDGGPVYDCIVFHDGDMWRVCLDTSECGDLANCVLLGEYSKTYEFSKLTKADLLNYSVNVYDDGNLLEITSISSSHGTHVASIAAAFFPDQPEKNGVAPGAQIVSLTIGDQRIDTMETGTGLTRAMIKVMESQGTDKPITVINMSYGEHSHFPTGRLGELMNEVIDKYGVTWVAAAGNHGPCLTTVGAPPDIGTDTIIGVGAYVSPEMMVAEYSLRNKNPGGNYTWSSRGPTSDGQKGVTVCAPGGAITSVPQYLLRNAQLLNGTSMASPHVAGAVALLLSGLKSKGLSHSPYSVKRALENTAQYLPTADHFAQGHGLLQVEKAFDHLVNFNDCPYNKIRFSVSAFNQKGIYMRGGLQDKPKEYNVVIEPVFADSQNIDSSKKISFQVSLSLACDQPWVSYPTHLELNNLARTIHIKVDPSGLPTGVHSTSIRAYDVKGIEKGPLFNIEVTVVRPVLLSEIPLNTQLRVKACKIKPGEIRRHFIVVPPHCSYAAVKVRVLDGDKQGSLVIHAMQLVPNKACRAYECYKMLHIKPSSEGTLCFQVKPGVVMEFVVAKFWSEQSDSTIDYGIKFAGCPLNSEKLTIHHAEGVTRLDINGGLQAEEVTPSINLKSQMMTLKPSETKISPCSSRDVIPPSRHIYQLVLTYNFHLPKAVEVTPNCGLLSKYLYESEYESQMWMLFDSNKQLIASGDAFPNKYNVKLEKGDYVLKLMVRQERKDLLEKLLEMPIMLIQKLNTQLAMDVYATQTQAMIQGKKVTSLLVPSYPAIVPVFVSPMLSEKTLKNVNSGQYLMGTISLSKGGDPAKKVDQYPFRFVLTDYPKKTTSSSSKSERTKWEEYNDALRDLKTNWLTKLDNTEQAEQVYRELKEQYPTHYGSHMSMLQQMDPDSKRILPGGNETDESLQTAKVALKIATDLLESLDEKAILAYQGIKSDMRPEAATIKTAMEKQKSAIIEAITRKGSMLCRFYLKQSHTSGDGEHMFSKEAIDELWLTLMKFVDPSEVKTVGYFGLWHAAAHNQYGRFLKMAMKMYEEKPSLELEESIIWCLKQANWDFAAKHISRSTLVRFPPTYRLF